MGQTDPMNSNARNRFVVGSLHLVQERGSRGHDSFIQCLLSAKLDKDDISRKLSLSASLSCRLLTAALRREHYFDDTVQCLFCYSHCMEELTNGKPDQFVPI